MKGAVFPLVPLPLLLLPLIPPTPSPTRGEGGVWASRCLKREKVQAEALPERVEAPAALKRLCRCGAPEARAPEVAFFPLLE